MKTRHGLERTNEIFPIEVIRRFRRQARSVRQTLENRGPNEWCRAEFDAARLVYIFPALTLRPGYRLLTYLYRSGGNGNGSVVTFAEDSEPCRAAAAVPAGTPIVRVPGKEDGAGWPMEAIDGDGSPLAYLSASLLAREFREVGAMWHGIDWDVESVLAPTLAWLQGGGRSSKHNRALLKVMAELDWPSGMPPVEEFAPVVCITGKAVRVDFYTYSELGGRHVTRWTDSYAAGSYVPSMVRERVASGPGGFVF